MGSRGPALLDLPDDVIDRVFARLSFHRDYGRVARVSRAMRAHAARVRWERYDVPADDAEAADGVERLLSSGRVAGFGEVDLRGPDARGLAAVYAAGRKPSVVRVAALQRESDAVLIMGALASARRDLERLGWYEWEDFPARTSAALDGRVPTFPWLDALEIHTTSLARAALLIERSPALRSVEIAYYGDGPGGSGSSPDGARLLAAVRGSRLERVSTDGFFAVPIPHLPTTIRRNARLDGAAFDPLAPAIRALLRERARLEGAQLALEAGYARTRLPAALRRLDLLVRTGDAAELSLFASDAIEWAERARAVGRGAAPRARVYVDRGARAASVEVLRRLAIPLARAGCDVLYSNWEGRAPEGPRFRRDLECIAADAPRGLSLTAHLACGNVGPGGPRSAPFEALLRAAPAFAGSSTPRILAFVASMDECCVELANAALRAAGAGDAVRVCSAVYANICTRPRALYSEHPVLEEDDNGDDGDTQASDG